MHVDPREGNFVCSSIIHSQYPARLRAKTPSGHLTLGSALILCIAYLQHVFGFSLKHLWIWSVFWEQRCSNWHKLFIVFKKSIFKDWLMLIWFTCAVDPRWSNPWVVNNGSHHWVQYLFLLRPNNNNNNNLYIIGRFCLCVCNEKVTKFFGPPSPFFSNSFIKIFLSKFFFSIFFILF